MENRITGMLDGEFLYFCHILAYLCLTFAAVIIKTIIVEWKIE
jgi:hypothetical protein